jgi:hypothetical protein
MTKEKIVAISLATFHAVLFLAFLAYYQDVSHRDGQAMLLWTYWLVIDFPVSLLVPLGWSLIDPDSPLSRYWLYGVHGVIGTIWWYVLPLIVARVYRRFVPTRTVA